MTPPPVGVSETIAPGLRRILAPNPGPMTHWGTNSFILGEGDVAIVDPGPKDSAHLEALLQTTRGERITHILVTHAHADHSPLARALSEKTGAPVLGFGPPEAGRSATMTLLAQKGLAAGGEGVDKDFKPDQTLADRDVVQGPGWQVTALHTPGHFAGHLAFRFGDVILSGDHVMDWSSSLVSPPDGDLGAFMRTSERLKDEGATMLVPGHGGAISDPKERLDWLTAHRKSRETAILSELNHQPQKVDALTARVYTDVPSKMLPAAARNVFAHLIDLVERNLVAAEPELAIGAEFRLL